MKFANYILLALICLSSVFAATEVGRIKGSYYYRCYDDGTATFTGTTVNSAKEYTIPAYVTYEGKNYRVTTVLENVFNGKTRSIINIDKDNTGLLLKRNAFTGIKGLTQFNIYSKNVEAEIHALYHMGKNVTFSGEGLQNVMDKVVIKYLNYWGLPVRKNFNSVPDAERIHYLGSLAYNLISEFNLGLRGYNNTVPNTLFADHDFEGLNRLYRVFALAMGYNYKHIQVASDIDQSRFFLYVLINKNSGIRKWHVLDIGKSYIPYEEADFGKYIKREKEFIQTLSPNLDPNYFIIHNNLYNVENEVYSGPEFELFNDWLKVNGGQRTL